MLDTLNNVARKNSRVFIGAEDKSRIFEPIPQKNRRSLIGPNNHIDMNCGPTRRICSDALRTLSQITPSQ